MEYIWWLYGAKCKLVKVHDIHSFLNHKVIVCSLFNDNVLPSLELWDKYMFLVSLSKIDMIPVCRGKL